MRQQIRAAIVALFLSIFLTSAAPATEFAILIHREQSGGCDIQIDPGTFAQGGPLVIQPTLLHIDFPDYLLDSDKMITGELNPVLPQTSPQLPQGSFIFSIAMTDVASGEQITQFSEPIKFTVDASPPDAYTAAQVCLGYLDETTKPPVWEREDFCTAPDNGQLCGTTDHFSTFYIGLADFLPEPASASSLVAIGAISLRRRRRSS